MLVFGSLLAILSVVYTHPTPNIERGRDATAQNTKTLTALQEMMEKADTEDFRAKNLAHNSNMLQQPALSQIDDQLDIESNPENLADKNELNMLQQFALPQVDDQTHIENNQDYSPENQADKHTLFQVDNQEPNIESNLGFNAENLAQESHVFQQSAHFQATDTDGNQRQSHVDESNMMEEPALSQLDEQQADIASDDLAVHEIATIQQQSFQDLEDAMKDTQQQVNSITETADDIVALLQGEDITEMDSELEEERVMSQSLLNSFNSGLQVFVNQMNRMISKYSNVLSCFPRMQAEMQKSDENDDELVKKVVDRLANIQGQKNRQIRRLFQKIRQFIQTTNSKGQTLYKKIRRTLGSLLRSYEVVITCVRRRQG